jgi:hypothetical protein
VRQTRLRRKSKCKSVEEIEGIGIPPFAKYAKDGAPIFLVHEERTTADPSTALRSAQDDSAGSGFKIEESGVE